MDKTIAIVKWSESDGIAEAICEELTILGYHPKFFLFNEAIPINSSVVLTFAPYGRLTPIFRQIAGIPPKNRPKFVHWNFESLPDIRIPWQILKMTGDFRSRIGRLYDINHDMMQKLLRISPFTIINNRMHKFRYLGDCYYAYQNNLVDVFVDISEIYTYLYNRHGLPTFFVHWGIPNKWYRNLKIERDIDVLWMGKRRTKRRGVLLENVRQELSRYGVRMYVADNEENPFIFGEERIKFLNRAKITLNLLPTWHDCGFIFRYNLAATNRSLVVTEPFLPHYSCGSNHIHYIAVPVERITHTILHYLENDDHRIHITENAYEFVTQNLTLNNSIKRILEIVETSNHNY